MTKTIIFKQIENVLINLMKSNWNSRLLCVSYKQSNLKAPHLDEIARTILFIINGKKQELIMALISGNHP